jgi:hypothetical protein
LAVGFAALAMKHPGWAGDNVKNRRFDKRVARSYLSGAAAERFGVSRPSRPPTGL